MKLMYCAICKCGKNDDSAPAAHVVLTRRTGIHRYTLDTVWKSIHTHMDTDIISTRRSEHFSLQKKCKNQRVPRYLKTMIKMFTITAYFRHPDWCIYLLRRDWPTYSNGVKPCLQSPEWISPGLLGEINFETWSVLWGPTLTVHTYVRTAGTRTYTNTCSHMRSHIKTYSPDLKFRTSNLHLNDSSSIFQFWVEIFSSILINN